MKDDELKFINCISIRTQYVVWGTYRKRWMIETNGERESGKSVLAEQHDDDDDIIFIWKIYCSLFILRMDPFSLNNCFNAPGKKYVQILHHLHNHSLWLSSRNYKRLTRFAWGAVHFSFVPICLTLFNSGLWADKSFRTVTPSSAQFCCAVHDL